MEELLPHDAGRARARERNIEPARNAAGSARHDCDAVGQKKRLVHRVRDEQGDPIWRSLLNAIAQVTELSWDLPEGVEQSWFGGTIRRNAAPGPAQTSAEASADQKSEVIEALRWARQLLSTGEVKAQDVAIAATSTQDWDVNRHAILTP